MTRRPRTEWLLVPILIVAIALEAMPARAEGAAAMFAPGQGGPRQASNAGERAELSVVLADGALAPLPQRCHPRRENDCDPPPTRERPTPTPEPPPTDPPPPQPTDPPPPPPTDTPEPPPRPPRCRPRDDDCDPPPPPPRPTATPTPQPPPTDPPPPPPTDSPEPPPRPTRCRPRDDDCDPPPPPYDDAEFVSQTGIPNTMLPGESAIVSITMRNAGTRNWTAAGQYKLGSQNPQDNEFWTGGTRIYLDPGEVIVPGATKTFRFTITAPNEPGVRPFQWQMVLDQPPPAGHWFGSLTPNVPITIEARGSSDSAAFVRQSGIPDTMETGERATVTIAMRNTGSTTWTRAQNYNLGSQNDQDNTDWGLNRVQLSNSDSIGPEQEKNFRFTITAPSDPGTYNFQWRMVLDQPPPDGHWFGELTENRTILVTRPNGDPGCDGANPNDFVADNVALQACLDRGGTVALLPGNPGYLLAQGIAIRVADTILTSAQAPTKATLLAADGLWNPMIAGVDVDRFTIEYLIVDGNKDNRTEHQRCVGHRPGGSNITIYGESHGFTVRHVESRNALCGTALGVSGFDFEVANNLIVNNGFSRDQKDVGFAEHPWADGITAGRCQGGHIHHNIVRNSTDIGIVSGGGQGCTIENNTIQQTNVRAFAGIAVHHFTEEGKGNHAGSVFRNNMVAAQVNGLDFGISVGMHTWEVIPTRGGAIVDNSVTGAVVNLAVDGYEDGTVTGNALSTPRGSFSHNVDCPFFTPTNYTVAHTGNVVLQPEPDPVAVHFDHNTRCGTPLQPPPPDTATAPPPPPTAPQPTPSDTPTPVPIVWEDDNFDGLALGPLHGQNGWYTAAANRASAVVQSEGAGKVLTVDPGPGATIVMGKDVADQYGGRHEIRIRARVTGASEASLAKVEVRTYPNAGWDRKFQVFFGNSMRVNYAPSGAAVTFLPATVMGRWYNVRLELDLDAGVLDVWVDGAPAALDIPMHPGPITDLGLSGWDRAGVVTLDDLFGVRH